jgi:hypothetical protein
MSSREGRNPVFIRTSWIPAFAGILIYDNDHLGRSGAFILSQPGFCFFHSSMERGPLLGHLPLGIGTGLKTLGFITA